MSESPFRSPPQPPDYKFAHTELDVNRLAKEGYKPLMMAHGGEWLPVVVLMVKR